MTSTWFHMLLVLYLRDINNITLERHQPQHQRQQQLNANSNSNNIPKLNNVLFKSKTLLLRSTTCQYVVSSIEIGLAVLGLAGVAAVNVDVVGDMGADVSVVVAVVDSLSACLLVSLLALVIVLAVVSEGWR